MYFTLECTIYDIHVQNLAPGTVDCTTLLQEMMRADLVAVVQYRKGHAVINHRDSGYV